jgi:hypothetical protein
MPKRASAVLGPVAILFLVFVGLGVAQTSPGGRLLHALGISSPSEPYTELAFVNPASPGTPAPDATVRLAFGVHNVEGSAHMSTWTATTQAPSRAPIIAASGRLTLANGASDTVDLRIPTGCAGAQSRINVSLGGAHQTIGFWLSCPAHRARPRALPRAVPPAPSTVLTFINPAKPGTQHANETVQFAFKVDNHTPSSQSYAWTVTTQTPGRAPIEAATGHFTLPTYYFAVVPVRVRVVCRGTRSHISVSLGSASSGGAHQTIGFFVRCPSRGE